MTMYTLSHKVQGLDFVLKTMPSVTGKDLKGSVSIRKGQDISLTQDAGWGVGYVRGNKLVKAIKTYPRRDNEA